MRQTRKCARVRRNAYSRTRKNKPGAKGYHGIGPGPGIGPLRKGDLAQFGYQHVTSMSAAKRREALALAVKAYGSLTVRRKLNAVYVYTRNTAPASSAIFKADRNWVKAHYA